MDTSAHHAVSPKLVEEIVHAIQTVNSYGSIEIYVQNRVVTQITIRNIKKTSMALSDTEGNHIIHKNIRVSI